MKEAADLKAAQARIAQLEEAVAEYALRYGLTARARMLFQAGGGETEAQSQEPTGRPALAVGAALFAADGTADRA